MPLSKSSYLLPGSDFVPYLVEDIYVKGGYTVFKTVAARDEFIQIANDKFGRFGIESIDPRKQGSLAYVVEDGLIYVLQEDLLTWKELKFGTDYNLEAPLQIIGDNMLSIDSTRILPAPGEPGQTIALDENLNPKWVTSVANVGTRSIIEYEMDSPLPSGESFDFALPELAASIMMLKLEVNAIGLKVEGFTSQNRDDRNPFTFISDVNMTYDEGIRIGEELEETKFRRFSFMTNLEDPVQRTLYFRFTNNDDVVMTPKMTLTYLVIE